MRHYKRNSRRPQACSLMRSPVYVEPISMYINRLGSLPHTKSQTYRSVPKGHARHDILRMPKVRMCQLPRQAWAEVQRGDTSIKRTGLYARPTAQGRLDFTKISVTARNANGNMYVYHQRAPDGNKHAHSHFYESPIVDMHKKKIVGTTDITI